MKSASDLCIVHGVCDDNVPALYEGQSSYMPPMLLLHRLMQRPLLPDLSRSSRSRFCSPEAGSCQLVMGQFANINKRISFHFGRSYADEETKGSATMSGPLAFVPAVPNLVASGIWTHSMGVVGLDGSDSQDSGMPGEHNSSDLAEALCKSF